MDTTDSPPPTLWAVKLGDGQRENGGGSKKYLVSAAVDERSDADGRTLVCFGPAHQFLVLDGGASLSGDSHRRDGRNLSFPSLSAEMRFNLCRSC